MINLTRPDAQWLMQLLLVVEGIREDYPELFSKHEVATLMVAGQLIRSINK